MSDFIGDWNALLVLLIAASCPMRSGGCLGFGSAAASMRVLNCWFG